MTTKRRILFDVMGTLVYDPFYRELPAFFGLSFDELLAAKHPTRWVEFEQGAIDEARMLTDFFADGRSFDHAGLKHTMRSAYRWLDGMEPLVEELAEQHELHVCSNYPHWSEWIEAELALGRFLEWTFVSWRMGLRKPSRRFFEQTAERLRSEPHELLLIDDREDNCEAARAVGLDAIRFESADRLRTALAERGLATRVP